MAPSFRLDLLGMKKEPAFELSDSLSAAVNLLGGFADCGEKTLGGWRK
jgi:hypothetical protein